MPHTIPCAALQHHLANIHLGDLESIETIARFESIRKLLGRRDHVKTKDESVAEPAVSNSPQSPTLAAGPKRATEAMEETIISSDGHSYTEYQLLHVVSEIKDFQLTHGSLLKTVQHETESSVPARPVGTTILSTTFPRKAFDEAIKLQEIFNELYIRVASDPDWLFEVLGPLIEHDAFIAALWDIYKGVSDAGTVQNVICGVLRSDYMLHQPAIAGREVGIELKQVEINTFSAAGFCHAERIVNMHRRLGQQVRGLSVEDVGRIFPENNNTSSIVGLLEAAYHNYQSTESCNARRRRCILMPVQPYNFNIADERPIQYELWDRALPCYRCDWPTLLECTSLLDDRTLLYRPPVDNADFEVSVIYYRAGYDAEEYNDRGKETRLRLEMSRAIKCPDVLTHMTNMKAVQQALSMPGVLERFLPSENCASLRKTFMPMQVLDASLHGLEARKIAQDPERAKNYVLKPNRDGGGHNIHGSDIPTFLAQKSVESWPNYVLMRLIEPPPTTGALMTFEELYVGEVISELGILGTCLWRRSTGGNECTRVELMRNEVAGWTFKTKPQDTDEMSVVKGYGCFDCPLLTN